VSALCVGLLLGAAVVVIAPSSASRLRRLPRPDHVAPRGAAERRRRRDESPALLDLALVVDLVAAALDAGAAPVPALEVAATAVGGALADRLDPVVAALRLGAPWEAAWGQATDGLAPLRRALDPAGSSGAASATLLRSAADELRVQAWREAQVAAQRLGVRLLLPLGLCLLPAAVLVAVVPVVLALVSSVLG
jgi:pilus assembly protein TadC